MLNSEDYKKWGPLAALVGVWQGDNGSDVAPSNERGTEENSFRERMTFEPVAEVRNHEQLLYGLRYSTMAWRRQSDASYEAVPFHEEVGYWLWDPNAEQIYRMFCLPRGISVIAGGPARASDRLLQLTAQIGSPTLGICSNPFLDREFRTLSFACTVAISDGMTLTYEEDTRIQIKGQDHLFHHLDQNTLFKHRP